uniref:GDSL esterase/lipase APG n=1 Tax=Oryza nivara TaxID=4536 RepID=A0A0E0IPR2_ORYNI
MAQLRLTLLAMSLLILSPAMDGGGGGTVQAQIVPAVISFGDSTVDVGNNNYLPGAVFKANYVPYGVNFGSRRKPTGRFSDGKIVTDITAETLGFESYAPPYLSPQAKGDNLLLGANFASAASSYHDDTAAMYQLKYYKEYQSKLAALIGQKNATAILSDALYIVSTGTGDFIQNYYHNASLSSRYNVNSYCDLLISIFSGFANVGGAADWCHVSAAAGLSACHNQAGRSGCVERLNGDAETFNNKLNITVEALAKKHSDLKIAIFDIYTPLRNMSESPASQGFLEARKTCCQTGTRKTRVYLCNPATAGLCRNASDFVYFDGVHPSEAANLVIAESTISAGISLVT